MSFIQSRGNKYKFPGIVVDEKAFWRWRDFLCRVLGHRAPITEEGINHGYCPRCFRRLIGAPKAVKEFITAGLEFMHDTHTMSHPRQRVPCATDCIRCLAEKANKAIRA